MKYEFLLVALEGTAVQAVEVTFRTKVERSIRSVLQSKHDKLSGHYGNADAILRKP